jgi:hypothetical protein
VSAQRLGDKSIRRLERVTGQDILRAWGNGGYVLSFVATAHRHGWFDKKTEQWGWDDEPVQHYVSCRELFPEEYR